MPSELITKDVGIKQIIESIWFFIIMIWFLWNLIKILWRDFR